MRSPFDPFPLLPAVILAIVGCGGDSPTGPGGTGGVGSLFSHLKTFHVVFDRNLAKDQTDFFARHYDVFVGEAEIPEVYQANPNILLLAYTTVRTNSGGSFGPDCKHGQFCAEAFADSKGYDVEGFFLHYKQDVSYWHYFDDGGWHLVDAPGWNPDWRPGDPPASASERSESRVWGTWSPTQRWANAADPSWRHWTSELIASTMRRDGRVIEGVLVDEIVANCYRMGDIVQLDKTHEYWGETIDAGFSYIDDRYGSIPVIRENLVRAFGPKTILVGNAQSTWFLASEQVNASRLQGAFTWFLLEDGVRFSPNNINMSCSYEKRYGDLLIIHDLAEQGMKILFGGIDTTDSERGSIFVLAVFYLINHPNMYFGKKVSNWHEDTWFDAIAYDVGQPTGEPEEWAVGNDPSNPSKEYHIVARSYTGALVLVKFRHRTSDDLGPASATTHDLGEDYRPLRMDGTLGDPVSQITLKNSEGVILMPANS